MSTYYATFRNAREARALLHELLRAGVGPDDVSLLVRNDGLSHDPTETTGTVGDATSFVGRGDDPKRDELLAEEPEITDMTSVVASPIGGIDTSDKSTDVDSIDQTDDSQSYAEDAIHPWREISQGEHENDDLVLATETGFPTPVPVIDDVRDAETPVEDEMDDALQSFSLSGVGTVYGGGALATAALSFDDAGSVLSLRRFLVDRGLPDDHARSFCEAYERGDALLGVEVTPGAMDEQMLERTIERFGPQAAELVDAPRFYDATRGDAALM